jgi:hypothetical protein
MSQAPSRFTRTMVKRGRWYGLAVLYPGEFVKPGTEHGFTAQNYDPPLADHDLGAAAREAREIGADRVSPFGKDWTDGAEEKRIARRASAPRRHR